MRILPLTLLLSLVCVQLVSATESRVESMGKRDIFFRDDMSVFRNPAEIGVLGNFITGSLGFVSDVMETTLVNPHLVRTNDTIILNGNVDTLVVPSDSLAFDTRQTGKTGTPTNQWFGVVYNYAVNRNITILMGAAFNREDDFALLYDKVKHTRKYRAGNVFPDLKGKSDFMVGAHYKTINVGLGYYRASQDLKYEGSDKKSYGPDVALTKINLGTEVGLGSHSLEVFGGIGSMGYSNKAESPDTNLDISSATDNSAFAGARLFLQTKLGGGLVFVPAVNYAGVTMFDSSATTISGGLGLNLRLDQGFFWAGLEGESFSGENDSLKLEESGYGVHFNFGIEKSLIWKWFIVRVGGHKYFGVRTITVNKEDTKEWVENAADNGRSDDFLGFGVGLNYQNRLRFDITLNEWVPYFNPFGKGLDNSPNGGHMLLRISSTFSL